MGDSYVEVLVGRDRDNGYFIQKIVLFVLCAICIVLALGTGISILFVAGVGLGVIGGVVIPNPDYEFEYLFIGKELSIDKIIAKSKRKTLVSYDLNKMEFMCPLNSHELDAIKNKKPPVKNFSSGKPEVIPYVIVYNDEKGTQLVYVEPDKELLTAIKTVMPRKVIEY